ncbi:GrpE protein-like, mitochondrial [Hondaea fermentalgiana]|uniref:GrpE protein-like, mitochondrial n=1 Tax=Hondaea fermentalgiana TaxID=2315210 RepID=A0A2R5G7U4_9STRA|nr:GrpE protein-like, mitochondrial [Hondaea fermentalgiana]|eukprot:GBG24553.1 GrpE protein-like, mitochondrial [Hondaea fermentalgiana]
MLRGSLAAARGARMLGAPSMAESRRRLVLQGARGLATGEGKAAEGEKKAEESAQQDAEAKPEAQAEGQAQQEEQTGAGAELEELQGKVSALQEELKDAKDQTLRTLAEMENVRQRTQKDIESRTTYANSKFAKSLLDVADNLTRALESVPQEALEGEDANAHLKSLYEGISMTEKELSKVFAANGISSFGEAGEPFDPHMHEAFFQMPNPELKHNSIAQVLKKGYKFKERVLRPAQVGTVNNPSS